MAIHLEKVTFGVDNLARSPLAPVSLDRGQVPRPVAEWTPNRPQTPQACPIVVIANLLPEDPIQVAPVFRRDNGEQVFRWSVSAVQSDPIVVTNFGVEQPLPAFAAACAACDPRIGRILPIRQTFAPGSNNRTANYTGFADTNLGGCISCRDITLRWTMAADGAPAPFVQDTRHRLYVIIAPPTLPWSAAFEDRERWLWPEVLDFACNWACGAASPDEAAERITRRVFALGDADHHQGGLRYGSMRYTAHRHFECGKFLDHLLGLNPDSDVDCRDLGSIVSTIANAVGCRLHQAQCGQGQLLGAVRLVGGSAKPPNGFSFHELVWDGSASQTDRIWDACLAYDQDCPAAVNFGTYAGSAFQAAPAVLGPLYTTNRPVKPPPPAQVTDADRTVATKIHPEIKQTVPDEETELDRLTQRVPVEFEKIAAILRVVTQQDWLQVDQLVLGESALRARLTAGNEGAAEVRLSKFETSADAANFVMAQARNVSARLEPWAKISGSDFIIGSGDRRTALVKIGRVAIVARVAFGKFDLPPVVEMLATTIFQQLATPA